MVVMRWVLVVLLVGRVAYAQPGASEPIPPPPSPPAPALLSESAALWLSLGGTLGSYTLYAVAGNMRSSQLREPLMLTGALGIAFAPSFGHWYAGKFLTRGLGIRAASIGVGVVAVIVAVSCDGFSLADGSTGDCGPRVDLGLGLLFAAAGMWLYGMVDDIVTAPRRVARINQARLDATYALVPTASDEHVGFALVGRF